MIVSFPMSAYTTELVKIGTSRGVRIPREMIKKARLSGKVEIASRSGELVIRSPGKVRQGWEEQFRLMAERGDDALLDDPTPTDWDRTEWKW